MKEQIAQWVIDCRYRKTENDGLSDSELYYMLIDLLNDFKNASYKEGWDDFRSSLCLPEVNLSSQIELPIKQHE